MTEEEARKLADMLDHFFRVDLSEMKKARLAAKDAWSASSARPPLEGARPGESQKKRYMRLVRQMHPTSSNFEEDEKWLESATEDKIRQDANLYERFIQSCRGDGIIPEDD